MSLRVSCIEGIRTSICRDILKVLSPEMVYLISCSIQYGIFRKKWAQGCITVIPKSGKLSDPSNWRPITQTPIFAKVLHRGIVQYFDDNSILSPYEIWVPFS